MKTVLIICLIFFFSGTDCRTSSFHILKHNPPPPKGALKSSVYVSQAYFTQKLDHESNDEITWSQRYFVNKEYFNTTANNVVFLMLGGESEASERWMIYGSWLVSAQKYGALLFQLEHRFYGKSHPFSDLSTENLRYLSSEQALADAANFIKAMNEQYSLPSDVKWIVFGGSYSGSLAAWLRLKYPDLVQGAVSTSGPLLAKLDFYEYFQVVIDDLAAISQECVNNLTTAMKQVDDLLYNPSDEESLTSIFNLCEPIEGLDVDGFEVANFYTSLTDAFASVAQSSGLLEFTIDDLCDPLTDQNGGKEIVRLSNVVNRIHGTQYGCLSYDYATYVAYLKDTKKNGDLRQWIYQTCTEFGWYQTTSREDKIFGKGCSIDFNTNLCVEVFGKSFNETFINAQIDRTNANYGGIDIAVSNVVYVHGSLDPWHAAGLTETTNPDSPVIFIEGTSHCADMYETTENELPQLTAAKNEVDRLIGVWLGLN
ncbi:putative serine protease K12H4.7 isoform X2 [Anoplophora glabripennis]|uniref:putative serine protease K12H4.7 isoform X2 n=1 Tax=Anoplophora glabripennis TaxID=217634 RepID=UPI000874D247|nr:putative serine protease K12H4.7 isoform X2 [Anoplophora glabripennis]